jgi:hypothetical protein
MSCYAAQLQDFKTGKVSLNMKLTVSKKTAFFERNDIIVKL